VQRNEPWEKLANVKVPDSFSKQFAFLDKEENTLLLARASM